MSKFIVLALSICAFSFHAFADEAESGTEIAPIKYDLADANKGENRLDVHAAVEKYFEEHPDCESQRERICEAYVLKSKSEKCGDGYKLAESDGWNLNATKINARNYERSPSQGGSRPPGQSQHKAYGFGVCHKF